MVTQSLFTNYELVLPHFWSKNVVYRDIVFPSKPSSVTLRYIIQSVGRYHFGVRREETNLYLGFSIVVNGYDAKVLYPVRPSDWETVDITPLIVEGSNRISCVIWRSIVDWVDDWFVDFSIDMISDVEGSLQPLPSPTPSGSVFDFFNNLIAQFLQFMGIFFILYIFIQFLPTITSFLRETFEEKRAKRKKEEAEE
jgi:hypothetical protein